MPRKRDIPKKKIIPEKSAERSAEDLFKD